MAACVLWAETKTPEEIREAFRKRFGNKGYVPGGKLPSNANILQWAEKFKKTGSVQRRSSAALK